MKSLQTLKSLSPSIKISPFATVVFLLLQIIELVINVIISWTTISWIQNLDQIQCECSENWKKSGLEYWAYFTLFMSVITFILNVFFHFSYNKAFNFNPYFMGLFSIFSFMNTIGTLLYIYNLKSIDCECSEDMKREILYIYNWFKIALLIITLILIVAFIFRQNETLRGI
jgi:hypothetical protein